LGGCIEYFNLADRVGFQLGTLGKEPLNRSDSNHGTSEQCYQLSFHVISS
jgi:hypothetical protein